MKRLHALADYLKLAQLFVILKRVTKLYDCLYLQLFVVLKSYSIRRLLIFTIICQSEGSC